MNALHFTAESIRKRAELKSIVSVRDEYKDIEDDILNRIATSGAILKGHFHLEGGQHSELFFRFNNMASDTDNLKLFADRLAAQLKKDNVRFDAVIMQESSGRSLGEVIANNLSKRKIFVETDELNRPIKRLINESTLYRGDRVLLATDLSTSGHGLVTMTELVHERKAKLVGVVLFAVRSKVEIRNYERQENVRVYAITDLDFGNKTYGKSGSKINPEDCAACRKGEPIIASWET